MKRENAIKTIYAYFVGIPRTKFLVFSGGCRSIGRRFVTADVMTKSLFSKRVSGQNKRKSMSIFLYHIRHTLNVDFDE